jgi:hypothetical protein
VREGPNYSGTGLVDYLENRDGLDDDDDVRSVVRIIAGGVALVKPAVSLGTNVEVLVVMVVVVVGVVVLRRLHAAKMRVGVSSVLVLLVLLLLVEVPGLRE